jgi:hypothetical protein
MAKRKEKVLTVNDSPGLKSKMRRFVLIRDVDKSGNSGTGLVAEGVQFSCGRVVMTWLSHLASIAIYENIGVITQLHGHEGATNIFWVDNEDA